ncbi:MAG: NAD(P)/FAD-dependent oxidoreductase [Bacteroidota bacterium]
MLTSKVCIIGAGPAGTMAALRLGKEGIPFVILDKDEFPREKICGDALSGKVPHIMRRLSPDLLSRFEKQCRPLHSFGMRFVAPGDYTFDVPFIYDYDPKKHPVPGYTLKRELFDSFMLEEVKNIACGSLLTGCEVFSARKNEDAYVIETSSGVISAELLIDASGTSAQFNMDYDKPDSLPKKTALAVRAYYRGVTDIHPRHFVELYFLPEVLPGYFWIFPLPGGIANVGVGIRKDVVLKKKINLSAVMEDIISRHPLLAPRFKDAERTGKPAASPLPLGNPAFRISGDHYMLAGDAAHLIDPLTGEGVGNAMYSGFIAAEQAINCFAEIKFDADFMHAYDKRIKRVLGKEMSMSANFQKMLQYPGVVRWIAKKADGNKHIPGLMSSMFTDLNHRKKLLNPFFILRVLLNR